MRDENGGSETAVEDVGEDLEILGVTRPALGGGGLWVEGRLAGHRFQALVFAEHADNSDFEVGGDSRISKLWVKRLADGREVFNWDRGLDVPAADATAQAIIGFLCEGLAEYVYDR